MKVNSRTRTNWLRHIPGIICVFTILAVVTPSFAQMRYEKLLGENGTEQDRGRGVAECSNGDIVIAGFKDFANVNTPENITLTRTDACGNILWSKRYQTYVTHNARGEAHDVLQDIDGGFVVCGYTETPYPIDHPQYPTRTTHRDAFILKTDGSGNIVWWRIFGGEENDEAHAIMINQKGNYLVTGYTMSYGTGTPDYKNVLFAEVLSTGLMYSFDWYGGDYDEEAFDLLELNYNGSQKVAYVMVGSTMRLDPTHGMHEDIYMIRRNMTSPTDLEIAIGWPTSDERGTSLVLTQDGQGNDNGYIITGYSDTYGSRDVFLSEVVLDLSNLGIQTIFRDDAGDDIGQSIQKLTNSQVAVAGTSSSWGTNPDNAFLFNASTAVSLWLPNWWNAYTADNATNDAAFSLALTSNGGYVLTGEAGSTSSPGRSTDMLLVRTTSSGQTNCETAVDPTPIPAFFPFEDPDYDTGGPEIPTPDPIQYVSVTSMTAVVPCPGVQCKGAPGNINDPAGFESAATDVLHSVAALPNPLGTAKNLTVNVTMNAGAKVVIRIVDARGRVAISRTVELGAGDHSLSFDIGGFAAGSYNLTLQAGTIVKTLKIVKTR